MSSWEFLGIVEAGKTGGRGWNRYCTWATMNERGHDILLLLLGVLSRDLEGCEESSHQPSCRRHAEMVTLAIHLRRRVRGPLDCCNVASCSNSKTARPPEGRRKDQTCGVVVLGRSQLLRPSKRPFPLVKTPRYCLTNDPNVAMHPTRCLLAWACW